MKNQVKLLLIVPALAIGMNSIAESAAQKQLVIKMSKEENARLKHNKEAMVIAKSAINSEGKEVFNVVWSSGYGFNVNTTYSWVPMYSLAGQTISNISPGSIVSATSNQVQIGLGQKTGLSNDLSFSNPISGPEPTEITVHVANNYSAKNNANFHVILSAPLESGPGASPDNKPFFIDTTNYEANDTLEFQPIEKVKVWFQSNVKTSSVVESVISAALTADFTEVNDQTWKYNNGHWTQVNNDTIVNWQGRVEFIPQPIMTAFIAGATVTAADLALKVNTKLTGVDSSIRVVIERSGLELSAGFYYKRPESSLEVASLSDSVDSNSLDSELLALLADSLDDLDSGFSIAHAEVTGAGDLYTVDNAASLFEWAEGDAHIYRRSPDLCVRGQGTHLEWLVTKVKGREYIEEECRLF